MIKHIPVLLRETIQKLAPLSNENFIDATCGFGGHTKLILEKNGPKGRVLAVDQDRMALEETEKNLKNYFKRVDFVRSNFAELGLIVRSWKVSHIDGILFDLGVSTFQLKTSKRGFSFNADADLDMRMSPDTQRISARDIVNKWSPKDLRNLLYFMGEEPQAKAIARAIVKERSLRPIVKVDELVAVIKRALPPRYRLAGQKHFATSTFRALRMAVNQELENLKEGLKQAVSVLSPGGRIAVISFHSLEDRMVKNFFREREDIKILTPKPITPTLEEIKINPSARSGKLRAAIKM